MTSADLATVRTLLARALYDLECGWPAAAYDVIARAAELVEHLEVAP